MIIGVPREAHTEEKRVALTPHAASSLKKKGLEILIESGAGMQAGYPDSAYQEAGARILSERNNVFQRSDLIIMVRGYGANPKLGKFDLSRMRKDQLLVCMLEPLASPNEMKELSETGVIAFALELLPRITRAQSMDVLSSQASISGYKAVILAAEFLPRLFPMMTTAAGTLSAARVFVIGAGVAGLQAIATAKRLGAVVQGYDVRASVKEQVQSLGARFVELDLGTAEGQGGYAKEMDEAFYEKQREMMAKVLTQSDVVITTASVPGRRAPVLIDSSMVRGMAPGSVIIDISAERGGNCELTKPGEVVEQHDVTIAGPLNLPSSVPYHASQAYANNIAAFILNLVKDGQAQIDMEDEIIRDTLVCRDGAIVNKAVQERLDPRK